MTKTNFNDFRFNGLDYKPYSAKYFTMKRVSSDESKIVVKVADVHLKKTKYGYALILDRTHVVFLKDWQVDRNYFGNEVLLQKEYYDIKEWGNHEEFEDSEDYLSFDGWLKIAYEQDNLVDDEGMKMNKVRWRKHTRHC